MHSVPANWSPIADSDTIEELFGPNYTGVTFWADNAAEKAGQVLEHVCFICVRKKDLRVLRFKHSDNRTFTMVSDDTREGQQKCTRPRCGREMNGTRTDAFYTWRHRAA